MGRSLMAYGIFVYHKKATTDSVSACISEMHNLLTAYAHYQIDQQQYNQGSTGEHNPVSISAITLVHHQQLTYHLTQ